MVSCRRSRASRLTGTQLATWAAIAKVRSALPSTKAMLGRYTFSQITRSASEPPSLVMAGRAPGASAVSAYTPRSGNARNWPAAGMWTVRFPAGVLGPTTVYASNASASTASSWSFGYAEPASACQPPESAARNAQRSSLKTEKPRHASAAQRVDLPAPDSPTNATHPSATATAMALACKGSAPRWCSTAPIAEPSRNGRRRSSEIPGGRWTRMSLPSRTMSRIPPGRVIRKPPLTAATGAMTAGSARCPTVMVTSGLPSRAPCSAKPLISSSDHTFKPQKW